MIDRLSPVPYGRRGIASEGPVEALHGRRSEREALEQLLEAVRGGQSRVVVVTGEPGVGKTALLEFVVPSASGFRVLRAAGVESEMELAFAALQQLCAPLLDRVDRLPAPQRDALAVAFRLRAADAPDRFLVGLAALSLLSEAAGDEPLLGVVEDAQWLDRASAQALVFVARRLLAESVALILVTREAGDELEGLPTLAMEGLPDGDARALLSSALRVPLDAAVRERLIAETRGNPLALLELPRGLRPAELAGGFGLPARARGPVSVASVSAENALGPRGVPTPGARYGRPCMVLEEPAEALHDRRSEREMLDRLLEAVRGGQSRVLVVSGEPGVGKTALLESAVGSAPGFRVIRAIGVESEMELAFAALQQLCAPMLHRLDRLAGPQRDALGVAFGLRAGEAPDRFLVGLAVLSLFSEVAEERPLLCVVDDAQWLDRASAQALVFVARRLLAESVALVFVTRDPSHELAGLPELVVEGLGDGDAQALLDSALGVPLDQRVRERLVAETRGNPLALLELPRGLTPAQLAGGFGLPDAPGLSGRIEDSFRSRLGGLAKETQRLLLVAAAEPVGDPVLLWRAAERLGIGPQAADQTDGLLTVGTRVTFRHPLVRSAVYQAASTDERRAVHRALADATDPELDPDRRAWHLAHATPGLDEEVASELERSAGRARARGGLAAAAAFLERAAALTPGPSPRAGRALAAAQAKHQAGAFDAALGLLATAKVGPLDELQLAQVDLLYGQIAFALSRGSDAPPLLLKAAKRFEPLDGRLAGETYLEALTAALLPGRLVSRGSVLETAQAARAAPPSAHPSRAPDLLLDGLTRLITDGLEAGTPALRRAVDAFRSGETCPEEGLRWLWIGCGAAALLWDDESWDVLSARFVQLARDAGALTVLPLALTTRTGMQLFAGERAVAASLAEEVTAVTEATGSSFTPYAAQVLVAFRGREAEASPLLEAAAKEVVRQGDGQGLTLIYWATAVLHNGLGHYQRALEAAEKAAEDDRELWFSRWGLVELIEAAARSGNVELAADGAGRLSHITAVGGTDWALGVDARSRALVTEGEAAETLYRQAIERLQRSRMRFELARVHLLYGEWLRRERRRLDAREQLRTAHELFTDFGMDAFAERARVELEATGEHARRRTVETRDDLTPQEAQISRLAADGATNQEIAAQLFISPSTVDYHLRKTFRKLGVKSRHQLKQHVLQPPAHRSAARVN